MIGQCLLNKNKNTTVSKSKKNSDLNKVLEFFLFRHSTHIRFYLRPKKIDVFDFYKSCLTVCLIQKIYVNYKIKKIISKVSLMIK